MAQQGKHSRPASGSPTEKDAKQHKQKDPETQVQVQVQAEQPSAREIAAAEAARKRLYGSEPQNAAEVDVPKLPSGAEPTANLEIEYTSRDNLQPVDDASCSLAEGLKQAAESDWVANCGGLLLLRRLIAHNKQVAWQSIDEIVALTLKHVKSLRSSLCKTAIMCATDILITYKNDIVPLLSVGGTENPANSLLSQLLLKGSSNDKRFVIDEAKAALQAVADCIDPILLLPHVLPQTQHKNPKVRGVAATLLANSLSKLPVAEWPRKSSDDILKAAAKLVSDNTPDARNAAKQLIPLLHAAYDLHAEEKENTSATDNGACHDATCAAETRLPDVASWDAHCKLCLGGSANAVLKAV